MELEKNYRYSWQRTLLMEGGFPAYFFLFCLFNFLCSMVGLTIGGVFGNWEAGLFWGLLGGSFLFLLIVLDVHLFEKMRKRRAFRAKK